MLVKTYEKGGNSMTSPEASDTLAPAWRHSPQDPVSRVLIIVLIVVIIGCWSAMIWGTYKTYQEAPPLPSRFVTSQGGTVMTRADLEAGKAGFQQADLMDYGSLYGMGSYFGEDYTAQYLVMLGRETEQAIARSRYGKTLDDLTEEQRRNVKAVMQKDLQGIDLTASTVVLPDSVAGAINSTRRSIVDLLQTHEFKKGWTRAYSLGPQERTQTADFLIYSALTTVARRPGEKFSWTVNWPYEPLVGNHPTNDTFIWTWASLTIVFFGIGFVVVFFRLFIERSGVEETNEPLLAGFPALTPSQKALWKFFVVAALVLLVQIAAGAAMAHYYVERTGFYGLHIDKWLPFAFMRSVHLQTPIVWIGIGWIASALFLAPRIGRREPTGQRVLVNLLFWVTMAIVVGALLGDYLGIMGVIRRGWFWIGNRGLSYLELGRLWQILFFVGLLSWSLIVLRAMWPTLKAALRGGSLYSLFRAEHLLWYSTLGIAVIYAFGMIPLAGVGSSFTITDFWRWWVVHLWVEWAFELFTAAITGYFLMVLGLVSRQMAERAILFEWILILFSGILGTGHHMYWAGEPDIWIGIGSVFSFLEVLPLFLLVLEAVEQRRRIQKERDFPYNLAYLYILGSTFWNFVGAGIFGGATINAPLVNYYEHATFLTLNHAHTAMFGAFGMLAIGLVYLCLRYMAGNRATWSDKPGIWAFWLYNAGLVLWTVLNFFPVGWPQLAAVYAHGLAWARSLDFYNTTLLWQWLRMPGDVIFAIGAVIMAIDFIAKVRPVLHHGSRPENLSENSAT
jgi:nitric oxide reductase subunit B